MYSILWQGVPQTAAPSSTPDFQAEETSLLSPSLGKNCSKTSIMPAAFLQSSLLCCALVEQCSGHQSWISVELNWCFLVCFAFLNAAKCWCADGSSYDGSKGLFQSSTFHVQNKTGTASPWVHQCAFHLLVYCPVTGCCKNLLCSYTALPLPHHPHQHDNFINSPRFRHL